MKKTHLKFQSDDDVSHDVLFTTDSQTPTMKT